MHTHIVLTLAQVPIPGAGVADRIGDSLTALAGPLVLVAFIVFALVVMVRQLPGVITGLIGFILVASMLLSPGAWFAWLSYVATGNGGG